MKEWLLPTFGAFILWGFWGFVSKITVRYINPKTAIFFEAVGGIVFVIILLTLFKLKLEIQLTGILLAVLTGIFGFSGALCFLYAVSKGPASLIVILSALYPIVTISLAVFFLNESLTIKQIFGIILGIGAILLITG